MGLRRFQTWKIENTFGNKNRAAANADFEQFIFVGRNVFC